MADFPPDSSSPQTLSRRLSALDLTSLPIWVFDDAGMRFLWGNRAALELWRASSLQAFLERDLSDASAATRTRIERYRLEFAAGRSTWEVWTFYPGGTATSVNCRHTPFDAGEGLSALFVEAYPVTAAISPEQLRGVEALRHTSVMVTLLDETGQILMENPAALRSFKEASFGARFEDVATLPAVLEAARSDTVFRAEIIALTSAGERWHLLEARRTRDPSTGEHAVLVEQVDITARRENELTVARQAEEILALSAPVIAVDDGVLAVPLIGAIDDRRGDQLTERVLGAVVERMARYVIIDLTGTTKLGAESVERIARLLRAIALLGARPILTGIQPAFARALVGPDGHRIDALVLSDLHQALRHCRAHSSASRVRA